MKNLMLLTSVCAFLSLGCNRNEEWDRDISEISEVAVDSVKISGDTIPRGSAVTVKTYSALQTGCESFYKFNYTASADNEFTKEISAVKLKNKIACGTVKAVPADFSFAPKAAGIYTLKFRSGNGWLQKTLVVK